MDLVSIKNEIWRGLKYRATPKRTTLIAMAHGGFQGMINWAPLSKLEINVRGGL